MKNWLRTWLPTLILTFLASTIVLAGTGNLPQIVTSIIQRAHVNDIRSALSGDLVPRDSSGTVNDNSSNLGQSTHRWATTNSTSFCIYYSSGGNPICHAAASAPGTGYTITWNPSAPASSSSILEMSTGGAVSYATLDGSTIVQSAGVIQIPSSVNLPGNLVEENGLGVIVSAANASTSIKVLWGSVSAAGAILQGTGFTVSHSVTGSYTINFSSSFASTPAVIATVGGGANVPINSSAASTSSATIVTDSGSTNNAFSFVILGPR